MSAHIQPKILIVHSRSLCYFSAGFFLDRIEGALKKQGAFVFRCDINEEGSDTDKLYSLGEKGVDAIIDINSKLPNLMDEKGEYWLDKTNAKFFNYVLDHPLYHHPGLVQEIRNYYAISLNRAHCVYIEKNYPHVKNVFCLPVPGSRAVSDRAFVDRKDELLFAGTHIPDRKLDNEFKTIKETFGSDISNLILDILDSWDPSAKPLEEFVKGLCDFDRAFEKSDIEAGFSEKMNVIYLADRIKRERIREDILYRISKEVPLCIVGEGWDESRLKGSKARLLNAFPYSVSLELNSKYKCVLDINPNFYQGIHDRAANAMANGAMLISNMGKESFAGLRDKKELLFFDGMEIEKIIEAVGLPDDKKEEIAKVGNLWQKNNLTWEGFAKELLGHI